MKIRDATIKDSKDIANSWMEFSISEGIKREDIIYEKGLDHIKRNLFKDIDFKKIILNSEGVIIGGLFMKLNTLYYNNNLIVSDRMFFTSPSIRPYTRVKVAILLIKEAMTWAFKNNVKYFVMNMKFLNTSMIKFMKKRLGFYVSGISYKMELNYNGR